MKFALWSIVRLLASCVLMLVVIVIMFLFVEILYAVSGHDINLNDDDLVVIPIVLSFFGAFLIGYCPNCKFVITTKIFTSFWDRFSFDIPKCPKCNEKRLR